MEIIPHIKNIFIVLSCSLLILSFHHLRVAVRLVFLELFIPLGEERLLLLLLFEDIH